MKTYVREAIIVSLVIIILVLVLILLESINDISFSFINILETAASLGTLLAAIAAWKSASAAKSSARITSKQLDEMQQARKSQIKPDIYVSSQDYKIIFNPDRGFGDFTYKEVQPFLSITNIGQGHAKTLNFKWIYESIDKDVEFIRSYEFGKEYIKIYEPGKLFIATESGSGPLDDDLNSFTPLILRDQQFNLSIPFSYLEIFSLKHHLFLTHDLKKEILPNISLEVRFRDADANEYKKQFLITPKQPNYTSNIQDNKLVDYTSLISFSINEVR
ncbi:hypothetical protein [Sutcliffiella cohnii]|uniref:hypothetical protein n=1 Tax=Sutcliffiella cohnii TaxID=33932 RepID=UPI002E1AB56F|nr:hypothetical protein [Sutcliffiella cohnii]